MFQLAKFKESRKAWREIMHLALAEVPSKMFPGSILLPAPSGHRFAEDISRRLSRKWGIPYARVFHKNSELQSKGLTEPERYMAVQKGIELDMEALHEALVCVYDFYVIIDDMYTTGATLNQCARHLWEAGISKDKIVIFSLYFAIRESNSTHPEPDEGSLR